jgi:uncharacterized protein (TIGR00106 family)
MKAIAEIQIIPIGSGVSVRGQIQRAHDLLVGTGMKVETHASGTNVEGALSDVLAAVERLHAELHEGGAVRLITIAKFETRTDKEPSLAGKRL